ADPQAGADERHTGGEGDEQRLEDELELRDAEVELALEGREADEQAAHQAEPAELGDPGDVALGALTSVAPRAHALLEQDGLADERHARAAEEHQVRRAPEGHVLAEEAVPHVVEGEAEQGEAAARGDEQSAD